MSNLGAVISIFPVWWRPPGFGMGIKQISIPTGTIKFHVQRNELQANFNSTGMIKEWDGRSYGLSHFNSYWYD